VNYWQNKLNGPQAQPTHQPPQPPPTQTWQPPGAMQQSYQMNQSQAWWMAAPTQQEYTDSSAGYREGVDGPPIAELARMDASTLSGAALELVAAWKLKTNAKYSDQCPHCGKGTLARAKPSTSPRCFECGYSEREVHDQLQPTTRIKIAGDSIHGRDLGGNISESGHYQHYSQSAYGNQVT
jgi:predicted RNA-binding Zn-ribbon protein involved in translation (DUF1610 family)